MANSADPDQLASSDLIWIYTVCKGRVYPGSAGQGLTMYICLYKHLNIPSGTSDLGLHYLALIQQFLDTLTGSQMELFKF